MNLKFLDKKISGILSVVPKNRVKFMDELDNYGFTKEKMLNLKKVMGFDERRIVEENECTSDLCLYGLQYLLEKGLLRKNDIGAIILVTQSPDHLMPPTSTILHGKLGLGHEVLCFDINQGCTGYLYGLFQAFMLLQQPSIGKVILLNGDTLSRSTCPNDRNAYPLVGDAASISIIENTEEPNEIYINFKTDGSRSDWIVIPAGGFRMPSTEETRKIKSLPDGNKRSAEHIHMNGPGVFTFTQTEVPASIKEFFETVPISIEEIDYFMFHQPNRFILEKLAQKLGVPEEKMPSNIVEIYGNSSSATIPLAICHNIRHLLSKEKFQVCMSGFGVGLSWGTMVMILGPLEFCDIIEK